MEYVISIVCSVVSATLVFLLQSQIKENRRLAREKELEQSNAETKRAEREEALEEGVRQLLSVELEELYDRYSDKETVSTRVYSRWKKLHKAYKGLNGNGTFKHMDEEMEKKHIDNNEMVGNS